MLIAYGIVPVRIFVGIYAQEAWRHHFERFVFQFGGILSSKGIAEFDAIPEHVHESFNRQFALFGARFGQKFAQFFRILRNLVQLNKQTNKQSNNNHKSSKSNFQTNSLTRTYIILLRNGTMPFQSPVCELIHAFQLALFQPLFHCFPFVCAVLNSLHRVLPSGMNCRQPSTITQSIINQSSIIELTAPHPSPLCPLPSALASSLFVQFVPMDSACPGWVLTVRSNSSSQFLFGVVRVDAHHIGHGDGVFLEETHHHHCCFLSRGLVACPSSSGNCQPAMKHTKTWLAHQPLTQASFCCCFCRCCLIWCRLRNSPRFFIRYLSNRIAF